MDYCVVDRLQEDGLHRKFLNFFADAVASFYHMNTRSRDIAHLMRTFSLARETRLRCQLHRRVRAPHRPATVRYTLYACATLTGGSDSRIAIPPSTPTRVS